MLLDAFEALTYIIIRKNSYISRGWDIGVDFFADIQIHPPSSPLSKGGYEGVRQKPRTLWNIKAYSTGESASGGERQYSILCFNSKIYE